MNTCAASSSTLKSMCPDVNTEAGILIYYIEARRTLKERTHAAGCVTSFHLGVTWSAYALLLVFPPLQKPHFMM